MIEITTITFTKEDRNFICELYPYPRTNRCEVIIYEKVKSWWRETKKFLCSKTFVMSDYSSITVGAEFILNKYLADENDTKQRIAKWEKQYKEKKNASNNY